MSQLLGEKNHLYQDNLGKEGFSLLTAHHGEKVEAAGAWSS